MFTAPLQQTQIPDYAELIVKFLEALIDSYLPAADEEQLRTPTSPYPPTSQSQLSITANLNLSNSMTSLATSQHSPGLYLVVSSFSGSPSVNEPPPWSVIVWDLVASTDLKN